MGESDAAAPSDPVWARAYLKSGAERQTTGSSCPFPCPPYPASMHLEVLAPAKVNLTLHVLDRRPDGFHDLASLMVPISLADRLEITVGGQDVIVRVPGRPDLEGEGNLCFRAARAFRNHLGLPVGLDVTLHKEIPVAAGLGGGSSDAAAVLRALAHVHGIPLDDPSLHVAALEVGSDVPFFLHDGPAMVHGRGERLSKAPPLPPLHLVILAPPFGVSAAEAYGALARMRATGQLPPGEETPLPPLLDPETVASCLHNDLQPAVASLHPIAGPLERLGAAGGLGTLMSGSGSCLLLVTRDALQAEKCSKSVHLKQGERVFVAQTLQRAPTLRETSRTGGI